MKPEITAVVFDLDGLMFNTEMIFNKTGTELLRRRGITDVQPVVDRMMGRRAHEAFAEMIDHCKFTETIEELQAESNEIFHALLFNHIEPMPGLFDLLNLIEQQELPKAVATSSGRDYLEEILTHFSILDRFQKTFSSDDVEHGKPHPEIYLKASQELGHSPQHVLVLEDSSNGTKAAAAAGTHIVSVPHEFSRGQDFSSAKYIAESLSDPYILNLLRS